MVGGGREDLLAAPALELAELIVNLQAAWRSEGVLGLLLPSTGGEPGALAGSGQQKAARASAGSTVTTAFLGCHEGAIQRGWRLTPGVL